MGPICRSVADAAAILSVIAGPDPLDNFTLVQPFPVPDFSKALNTLFLPGCSEWRAGQGQRWQSVFPSRKIVPLRLYGGNMRR